MILKNSQITIYWSIETFFCLLGNVGLTNFFWWLPGVVRFIYTPSTQLFNMSLTLVNNESLISQLNKVFE